MPKLLPPLPPNAIPQFSAHRCSCCQETQQIPFGKALICTYCGKSFTARADALKNQAITQNIKVLIGFIIIAIASIIVLQNWHPFGL